MNNSIFIINSDGAGKNRLANNSTGNNYSPRFSPNGTKIAFITEDKNGYSDIAVMNKDGSNRRILTVGSERYNRYPKFSPDGNTIVFTAYR